MPGLFYLDRVPEIGELAVVDGDEGFHAANVRRIRAGEHVELSDGAGALAQCVVEAVSKGRMDVRVVGRRVVDPAAPLVTVVQALPKSERSELAVELATEAGADGFLAWQAAHCVARWDSEARVDKGLRRWGAVVRAAARQSRRPYIPAVDGVLATRQLAERVSGAVVSGAVVLVLHESAIVGLASAFGVREASEILLIVGPEGGISDDEIAVLTGAGAWAVRLGPSVLRTSSAAAVALGALGVLTARWDC
jgi:16S rRNA (uracil1498-N3)-methyltransferase